MGRKAAFEAQFTKDLNATSVPMVYYIRLEVSDLNRNFRSLESTLDSL